MPDSKKKPFISVLLPVYNGEDYLRESIDSVLSQSYREFELIIWDDCSTDSSPDIIARYQDPRIHCHHNQSNKGLFNTLNSAIKTAQGEWIRLWAQDDVMKPDCLQTEAAFIKAHPEIGLYNCAGDTIDEDGKIISFYRDQPYDPTPDVIPPALVAVIMVYHGPLGGNISFLGMKRAVFAEVGYFREDMICSGDFEMLARLSKNYLTGFIREPLVNLRRHKGQASQQRDTHVASWCEEKAIFAELLTRLPDEYKRHARWFYFLTYAPKRMHYLIARLVRRDFPNARAAYRAIRQQYSLTKDFLAWFLTVDNRLYKMKPKYRKG